MSTCSFNTAGATYVVWMVAGGDQVWADNFIGLSVERGIFPAGLLTTWPLLQRHQSDAKVGVWLLVAAAQAEANAREFIAARKEMEPDCALELAYSWPGRPSTTFPAAHGYHAASGWLAVFPSPLMQKTGAETDLTTLEAPTQH